MIQMGSFCKNDFTEHKCRHNISGYESKIKLIHDSHEATVIPCIIRPGMLKFIYPFCVKRTMAFSSKEKPMAIGQRGSNIISLRTGMLFSMKIW